MERYFAKGLESSAPTVDEESEMWTLENLSEVERKWAVRGARSALYERKSTMKRNKKPVEEGVDP